MTTSTKRNLAKGFAPVLLLTAALSLPSRADAQYSPYRNRPYGPNVQGTLDGFITAQNGRCPTIRDHRTNRTFYLVGNTRDLRPGDHVRLFERAVRTNTCGVQAPTIQVLEVRTIWASDQHRSAYYDAARDGSLDRFIVRNRNRGGWYADRYAYRQNGGERYGQYGQYGSQDGRYGPYDRRPAPPAAPAPNGPYDDRYDRTPPNDDRNGEYDDNGGQYDQNAPYDDQYDRNDDDRYDNGRTNDNRQLTTVDGTLDFNGDCPSVRSGSTTYDLAGDLGNFHDGDRVHVTGFVGGRSSCGGTALEVQEIRRR
jgi:hypothetical protein